MCSLATGLVLAMSAVAQNPPNESFVEYLQRSAQLANDDVEGRMGLAEWCQANGLTVQASNLYRQVLVIEPKHELAYERLVRIADTSRLPDELQRREKAMEQFPGFQMHVTEHFLVIYNTDKAWALSRAVVLEKTHDAFYQSYRSAGMRPLPLAFRPVCVLFDTHEQFGQYARDIDRMNMDWSGGYYSVRTNRVAFFNDQTNPAFKEVTERIAKLDAEVAELLQLIKDAQRDRNTALITQFRQELDAKQKELRFYRNRHKAVAQLNDTAKTTHEAVHQLAFNSGVQVRGVMYPFWLSEGLATNFETTEATARFGPHSDNPARRQILVDAREQQKLMPLGDFIVMTALPEDPDIDAATVHYAQAWGLYQYLFKYHRRELGDYHALLAARPAGRRDEGQLRQEFIDTFGSIAQVESKWLAYVKRLPR